MIEDFMQFIGQKKLCRQGDKILIAVSGGVDSVVLLDLFFKCNYQIAIAHCNFSLRGAESDEDENFVRNLATKYQLDIFVKKFNTKKNSEKSGLSIQETARNLRYKWFFELAEKHEFKHIAVAHHFDDQVETFFINLIRGSGVSGLRGMPAKRGKIIRPLLFARRQEIERFAKENNLQFREDSSNLTDNYLRNRIRHNILPEIEKLSTDFPVSIDKSLEYLSEDELLLKYTIEEKKRTIFSIKNKQIIISKNELFTLENSKTWLFYLIKDFGFNRSIVNEIYSAMMNEKVGKIFFSDKKQLLIDRGNLIIREKAIKIHTARKWHLRKRSISVPLKLKPKVVKKTDEYNMQNDPAFAYFDFEKLTFPLLIRRWKEGDHFFPFGMKGSKLVSDFLIDQKIDLFEKENIYVMLSGNEIIWVIGKRSSDKFKVSGQTRKIYQVQLIDDKNA